MLWSIGKDSCVMLWLMRKAFFGHVPIPCVHVDTSYKIPEMITFRDRLAKEWGLELIVGQNRAVLDRGETFPNGRITRVECCSLLKKDALQTIIEEKGLPGGDRRYSARRRGNASERKVFFAAGQKL